MEFRSTDSGQALGPDLPKKSLFLGSYYHQGIWMKSKHLGEENLSQYSPIVFFLWTWTSDEEPRAKGLLMPHIPQISGFADYYKLFSFIGIALLLTLPFSVLFLNFTIAIEHIQTTLKNPTQPIGIKLRGRDECKVSLPKAKNPPWGTQFLMPQRESFVLHLQRQTSSCVSAHSFRYTLHHYFMSRTFFASWSCKLREEQEINHERSSISLVHT